MSFEGQKIIYSSRCLKHSGLVGEKKEENDVTLYLSRNTLQQKTPDLPLWESYSVNRYEDDSPLILTTWCFDDHSGTVPLLKIK